MSNPPTVTEQDQAPRALSRRRFFGLAGAGAVSGAALLAASPAWAVPSEGLRGVPIDLAAWWGRARSLKMATFEGLVDETFVVRPADGASTELELVSVTDLSDRYKQTGRSSAQRTEGESFALLLRGRPGSVLDQGTYTLEQKALGSTSVLMVPVYAAGDAPHYEVVYNHTRPVA